MNISGTYNLEPSLVWSQSQTRRVELDCDTSEDPVIINLPSIESILEINASSVIIVINDASGNANTNNIVINSDNPDIIDLIGNDSVLIDSDGASIILTIVSDDSWSSIKSVPTSMPGYNELSITLPSATILNIGTAKYISPILVPEGHYPVMVEPVLELDFNSAAYDTGNLTTMALVTQCGDYYTGPVGFLTSTVDSVCQLTKVFDNNAYGYGVISDGTDPLFTFQIFGFENPTLGDSPITIKAWYKFVPIG